MRARSSRTPAAPGTGPKTEKLALDRLDVQAPSQPLWHYRLGRTAAGAFTWLYSSCHVEGAENLPEGPAVLCFSHQNWIDPIVLMAALPPSPHCRFFGPEQNDMTRGVRNRLMRWAGIAIPFPVGRRGLVAATRRAEELLAAGDWVGIAGEGRIHSGEAVILPLMDGPAYLAIWAGVPLVPIAINGTSWLAFRRRVRIRIGKPLETERPADRTLIPRAVAALTGQARASLLELASGYPDPPRTRFLGAWLTELFNEWPEGGRPAVPAREQASGISPRGAR